MWLQSLLPYGWNWDQYRYSEGWCWRAPGQVLWRREGTLHKKKTVNLQMLSTLCWCISIPMGMSLVVFMLTVATFVPALDPMYGTPHSSTRLCKITAVIFSVFLIQDTLKSDVDSAMFCKTGLVSEDTNIEDFTEVMTTKTKRLWGYIWMHPDQPTTLGIHPDAYPDQPITHNNNSKDIDNQEHYNQ